MEWEKIQLIQEEAGFKEIECAECRKTILRMKRKESSHTLPRVLIALPFETHLMREIARGVYEGCRGCADWRPVYQMTPYVLKVRENGERFIGAIVSMNNMQIVEEVARWDIPVLNVSSRFGECPVPSVWPDHRKIGRLAAEHLLAQKLKNFLYAPLPGSYYSDARWESFRDRIAQAGYRAREMGTAKTDGAMLKRLKVPTGIFCATDARAARLITVCQDMGIAVPEKVAVMGVDNDDLAFIHSGMELTSVDSMGRMIGMKCVELINRMLRGEKVEKVTYASPTEVFVRESTDVLRTTDPLVQQAVQYIRVNIIHSPRVADLAKSLGVSRRTLERRFKDALGRTLHDEIRTCRLMFSKKLLEETFLTVEDIAGRTGYKCLSRYYRDFKQEFGEQPAAFRKRVLSGTG